MIRRWILVALTSLIGFPCLAQDPADRDTRRRNQPGILIEPGGRFAPADVLKFSADGRHLYAAGDDKVLRRWEFDSQAKSPLNEQELLRWAVYRQKRGSIYAMAELPGGRVAVAGFGVVAGAIVVLDRAGKTVHALDKRHTWAIWALAASADGHWVASGHEDGEVRLWKLPQGKDRGEVVVLGKHGPVGKVAGRVVALAFEANGTLLSAGEDGVVTRWDPSRPDQPGQQVLRFQKARHPWKVSISTDGKWIAAGGSQYPRISDDTIAEVRSLRNPAAPAMFQQMPSRQHIQCLTLNADGSRLAVGAFENTIDVGKDTVPVLLQRFQNFASGPVHVYDLKGNRLTDTLQTTYFADVLAFHPREPYLVVAGGAQHEVTLWKLGARATRQQILLSEGRCLWSIAFDTKHPTRFGFQTLRRPVPKPPELPHPNDQGAGSWYVFDLKDRNWRSAVGFTPAGAISTQDGWTVHFGRPKPGDPTSVVLDHRTWYAVGPTKQYLPLELSSAEGLPRCYSFLPDRGDGMIRLVLGHYYGYTLYEINPRARPQATIRRVRAGQGHDGEVISLAPSADGKLLLTAGLDQTVCCWDLASVYSPQPELGAAFQVIGGKVVATEVAPGSPVADGGMRKGDEIVEFELGVGTFYYNRNDSNAKATPEQCVQQLRKLEPNRNHYFRLLREPHQQLEMVTGVRRFPVWRFLPVFGKSGSPAEWVCYRFRDYYYDASTNGSRYIGWQVNGPESGIGAGTEDRTPTYYTAELWHRRFHRPDKIQEVLQKPDTLPDLVAITNIEPPKVELACSKIDPRTGVEVTFTVVPRQAGQRVGSVSLWVNGALFKTWKPGEALPATESVPAEWLRRGGKNHFDLIADNVDGSTRATTRTELGPVPGGVGKRRLFAVIVGVGDYQKARNLAGKRFPGDLRFSFLDARQIEKAADDQGEIFDESDIVLLGDLDATTRAIRDAMARVAQKAGPDDHVLFFFSGHGMQDLSGAKGVHLPQRLTLITYDTNINEPATGLSNVDLARMLSRVRGHKLVLLDACHSGGADPNEARRDTTVHQIRSLMPDDVGPAILTASDFRHESLEDGILGQGVFTAALLQTLRAIPRPRPLVELAPILAGRIQNLSREAGKRNQMPNFEQNPNLRIPRNEADVVWFGRNESKE